MQKFNVKCLYLGCLEECYTRGIGECITSIEGDLDGCCEAEFHSRCVSICVTSPFLSIRGEICEENGMLNQ